MPLVTYLCIIICILNFVREISLSNRTNMNEAILDCGALYPPYVTEDHQYWRLFTAGFVHFSWWHLLMNLYVLWQLGTVLETGLGSVLFALLLSGSVVIGNIFSCYMGDNTHTVSAGMSTGLYGLLSFEIVIYAANYGWGSVFTNPSVLYPMIVNLLMNFMPGVGWKGHLGGACAGILFAVIWIRL